MNQYKIANLYLNFEGIEYDYFHNKMKDYIASDFKSCDINISYSNSDSITLPKGDLYKKIHRWHWIATENNKYAAFQIHPYNKSNVSLIEVDKEWKNINFQLYDFENNWDISNDYRSFAGAGDIFSYALLKHNGLVLHSSGINYSNNAILFSAPSGTGKSTHTALWQKYYGDNAKIINDDTPAIRFIDNVPYAFGTPWSGKTEINYNCQVPLRAIVFIEQSNENKIKQISGTQAVSLMLNETRKSVFPEMMDLIMEMINRLLLSTPIYLLSCNISREAVELVKNTLDL